MGVRGLTTYIKNHRITTEQEISLKGNPKLFIDGDALCIMLTMRKGFKKNGILWKGTKDYMLQYGGDYDIIYHNMEEFFKLLIKNEIHNNITIVLDGGKNIDMKKQTYVKRAEQKVKSIRNLNGKDNSLPQPMFAKRLFKKLMRENKISYVVAEEEADLLIASLVDTADDLIVTNDGDFFLLDIECGVISTNTFLEWMEDKSGTYPVYRCQVFASRLDIDKSMLPFIALVVGNDYSREEFKKEMQMKCGITGDEKYITENFEETLGKISTFINPCTVESKDVLDRLCGDNEEMKDHLRKELMEFDVESYRKNPSTVAQDSSISTILDYKTHFVSIQCDYITPDYSRDLRQCLYQILLPEGETVTEYYRAVAHQVQHFQPSISKKDLIFKLARFPANLHRDDTTLFLASLLYFSRQINDVKVRGDVYVALLLCKEYSNPNNDTEWNGEFAHFFCGFQSVLKYMMLINKRQDKPFQPPEIEKLLNGSNFHWIMREGPRKMLGKDTSNNVNRWVDILDNELTGLSPTTDHKQC